jgi:hypothetical protein
MLFLCVSIKIFPNLVKLSLLVHELDMQALLKNSETCSYESVHHGKFSDSSLKLAGYIKPTVQRLHLFAEPAANNLDVVIPECPS